MMSKMKSLYKNYDIDWNSVYARGILEEFEQDCRDGLLNVFFDSIDLMCDKTRENIYHMIRCSNVIERILPYVVCLRRQLDKANSDSEVDALLQLFESIHCEHQLDLSFLNSINFSTGWVNEYKESISEYTSEKVLIDCTNIKVNDIVTLNDHLYIVNHIDNKILQISDAGSIKSNVSTNDVRKICDYPKDFITRTQLEFLLKKYFNLYNLNIQEILLPEKEYGFRGYIIETELFVATIEIYSEIQIKCFCTSKNFKKYYNKHASFENVDTVFNEYTSMIKKYITDKQHEVKVLNAIVL